jgi:CubicO group peptidase (beta-lactamase class C family)
MGRLELIGNVRQLQPLFPTAYTPIYSNVGYALLGIALERASNKTMAQIFDNQLVRRLGLSGASFDAPFAPCKGVIPVNESLAGWQNQYGAYGA